MVPDQRINYYKQADLVRSDFVDSQAYCSWKDGILVFYDSPMEEVTKKLERWFNVNIVIKDEMLLNYRITGTLKRQESGPDNEIYPHSIDYIQEGDNIYMKKR